MNTQMVWYASYGSNLSRERFLCYIQGGAPKGSTKIERGCKDQSPPKEDCCVILPYELYFSGHSERWNGAPAFISIASSGNLRVASQTNHAFPLTNGESLGRMYLIRAEQFIEIVQQENNDHLEFNLDDLEEVIQLKKKQYADLRYGTIMNVGQHLDWPVLTFTSFHEMDDQPFDWPSNAYLSRLMRGLHEAYGYSAEQAAQYFCLKNGIHGHLTEKQLKELYVDVLNE